jgi:membrane protein YqaA with SNARE-associated domain
MQKIERIKKEIKIFEIVFLLIIILISFASIFFYSDLKGLIQRDINGYGFYGLFGTIFLLEFLPQVISPDYPTLLAILSGFNVYLCVLVAMVASFFGSLFAFFVGRNKGIRFVYKILKEEDYKKVILFWKKYGHWYVLSSAILPLPIPYFPILFGALNMKFRNFLFWGLIPRIFGFVLTGLFGYYGLILLEFLFK